MAGIDLAAVHEHRLVRVPGRIGRRGKGADSLRHRQQGQREKQVYDHYISPHNEVLTRNPT